MSDAPPRGPATARQARPAEALAADRERRTHSLGHAFRPFFLLGALYAAVSIFAWVFAYAGVIEVAAEMGAMHWHGHEMMFGFATAAIAGFLLTSVPVWTETEPLSALPLSALVALWVAGRAGMWLYGALPSLLVAAVDLAFLPALVVAVAPPVLRSRQLRNAIFPLLLIVLFAANLFVHLEVLGITAGSETRALRIGVWVLATMIAILGSRIVPAFTQNALKRAGIGAEVVPDNGASIGAVGMLLIAIVTDVMGAPALVAGTFALMAAAMFLFAMRRWQTHRTLGDPIVWVLHLAYLWLPLGLALKGFADFTGALSPTAALHGMAAGAIGTMVLAMTTRVALGQTGRPLKAGATIAVAYVLVTLSALFRVVGPLFDPLDYDWWILFSGIAWSLAFGIYVVVYLPILLGPRREAEQQA